MGVGGNVPTPAMIVVGILFRPILAILAGLAVAALIVLSS